MMPVKHVFLRGLGGCLVLVMLGLFLAGYWHLFHARYFTNIENSAAVYEQISLRFYESKPLEKVPRWIAFIYEYELVQPDTPIDPVAFFYAEIFKQYPDKLEEWIKIIDSFSDRPGQRLFWTALWLSNTEKGREYLEQQYDSGASGQKQWLIQALAQTPSDLISIQPTTPEDNDVIWGAFFASGDAAYVINLINVACLYDGSDDYLRFITAASAKWSLAANAFRHISVKRTLKAEAGKRQGVDKNVVLRILKLSEQPDGAAILFEETRQIIREKQSRGLWLDQ